MKYIIALLIGCFAFVPYSNAQAVEYAESYMPDLQKIGEGRFSFMVWDVYDAALYASEGQWKTGQPVILTLSYLRDLEGQKIAESSIDEIKKQGFTNEVQLNQWYQDMLGIFPNVEKDDVITGIYTAQKETVFYKNSVQLGTINDPVFGQAFFDIWLGEQTLAPDLRAQLLGLNE